MKETFSDTTAVMFAVRSVQAWHHAIDKHPIAPSVICPHTLRKITNSLKKAREINDGKRRPVPEGGEFYTILCEELLETMEAGIKEDWGACINECYDTIAVLYRLIHHCHEMAAVQAIYGKAHKK